MSKLSVKHDADSAPSAKGGLDSMQSNTDYVQMSHLLQSGWRVALAFLAPSLLGIWLDKLLGTNNLFTIIGVILAVIISKIVVIKFVASIGLSIKDNHS